MVLNVLDGTVVRQLVQKRLSVVFGRAHSRYFTPGSRASHCHRSSSSQSRDSSPAMRRLAVCVFVLLLSPSAPAQQPSPQLHAAIPSTGHPAPDQYRASRIAISTDDFGELNRYRVADAALKPPAPGENRVVFL